jgi:endonuclease III
MTSIPEVEEFVREVDRRLRIYGDSRHHNKADPLDELIFIILSAQTESYSYLETYKALRQKFPTRDLLFKARESTIAAAIKLGGLAKKKAAQIKGALSKIHGDTGKLSLSVLSKWDDETVEAYLTSLPGIGAKSARCIMMYSLGRKVFPVDTHVWRVCRRLGLAPQYPKPTPALEVDLEKRIPEDVRYTLHVNLVSHGRETCTTYWPKCSQCTLADICPSKDKPDEVWGQWRKPKGAWQNYAKRKA